MIKDATKNNNVSLLKVGKSDCIHHVNNMGYIGYNSHCQFDGTKEDRNCRDCPEFEKEA